MNTVNTPRPIHPIEARRAFGQDHEHPAVLGRIVGLDGDRAVVALATGGWATVAVDDPRYVAALQRGDLCRYRGRELVVLLNATYGLLGLAVGPSELPHRLAVCYGVCRLEEGWVVEISGEGPQPGWLIFRCRVEPVACSRAAVDRVN